VVIVVVVVSAAASTIRHSYDIFVFVNIGHGPKKISPFFSRAVPVSVQTAILFLLLLRARDVIDRLLHATIRHPSHCFSSLLVVRHSIDLRLHSLDRVHHCGRVYALFCRIFVLATRLSNSYYKGITFCRA